MNRCANFSEAARSGGAEPVQTCARTAGQRPNVIVESFNPWITPGLAGAKAYTWHDGPALTVGEELLRHQAAEICERRLRAQGYSAHILTRFAILLLAHLPVEHLLSFFFALDGRFLGWTDAGKGSAGHVSAELHPIASDALAIGATHVIVAHQHPRGRSHPSAADERWVAFASASLAAAGIAHADDLVIAGTRVFSMAAHRIPPEAWTHLPAGEAETGAPTAMPEEDADAGAINLALEVLGRHQQIDEPATLAELCALADTWMSTRDAPAVGILLTDVYTRPIACRLVNDMNTDGLIEAVRFAITCCAVRVVLIVHSPVEKPNLREIANTAENLDSKLYPFDIRVADAICTGPLGAQSLREAGLLPDDLSTEKEDSMKPLDLINAFRARAEKDNQETATALVSLARKQLAGIDCTKPEAELLQSGKISEAELTAAVEVLQQFGRKAIDAASVKRKFLQRLPKVRSAAVRIPQLERELAELRQIAAAGAYPADVGSLVEIVRANSKLFPEFAKDGQPDLQAIREHVGHLADEPVVRSAT